MIMGSAGIGLEELRKSLEEEIEGILSTDFKIDITETTIVPSLDDSGITYPNLETGIQKCKLIETCVLYIDLRKSTDLNLSHKRETMSKLYSTFIRSIMKSGGDYSGKVRNVVGDRVMILFDSANCFGNAYKTAVVLNSVVSKLLDLHFKNNEVKAGIGIDYGKMLVTKAGIIKKGFENTNYKRV
jgi:adenylate cyclase